MTILVVDDHEIDRTVLVRILQKLGYTADIATNGLEAVALVKSKPYQLVFMDIHMPDMDGITAASEILSSTPSPPLLIAVTGDGYKRKRCIELGMVDFIEKPIGIQRIRQSIDSLSLFPWPDREILTDM
ncbi:CheY-like chemotaxis protein [Paenibacillus favisporus]|uniref:CheY-like chemotaxis protein n=1 Tax=Paenibacillus favisporus TaxID=221028 RepID=A0ABV2EZF0_9BACL